MIVCVLKAHACHQNAAERFVLRFEEMHITRSDTRLAQLVRNRQNLAVVIAQILFIACRAVCNEEFVVSNRLNFQIIVKVRDAQQLLMRCAADERGKQLARLTCRAENQAFSVTD